MPLPPAAMMGRLGMIHIVACEAWVLLDLQGIEAGTDGNDYLFHSLATLLPNELIRPWPAGRSARKCHDGADLSHLE